MSQDMSPRNDGPRVDRLELHYRQQLSALVDGALAPDEARFLLRRLEHDQELAGSYERWQLYGDAMRGQLGRMAGPGFAAGVARALHEQAPELAATGTDGALRRGWVRWGGGAAALAASVAVFALFMGRTPDPGLAPDQAAPVMAGSSSQPAAPAPGPVLPAPGPQLPAEEAAPTFVASVEPAAAAAQPRRARPQPVVREPLRAVAVREMVAPAPEAMDAVASVEPGTAVPFAGQPTAEDPFASMAPPHARPWPRAALPQQAAGAFTASFGGAGAQSASRSFYPFEPAMPSASGQGPEEGQPLPPPPAAVDAPR